MIIQRLTTHLGTLKAVELQELARSCGVTVNGTKSVLAERLKIHFEQLYAQAAPGSTTMDVNRLLPSSVLSFDMGYRNLAFVQLTKHKQIKTWQVLDLELDSFHPSVMVPVVRRFVHDYITPLLPQLGHILIEQQRARSSSSHAIFEHTLRVNTVEALLWCALTEVNVYCPMEPIPRRPVDKLWQGELGELPQMRKKTASVHLVKGWLEQETVVCPDELVTMFLAAKKKDDLSDSLMQALAFYTWRENAIKYLVSFE